MKKEIISIGILFLAISFNSCSSGGPPTSGDGWMSSESEIVFFEPSSIEVEPESEFAIECRVSGVKNILGIGLDIKYDPEYLEYITANQGDMIPATDGFTFAVVSNPPRQIINLGFVQLASVPLGQAAGTVNGPGLIATLFFRTKQNTGQTHLWFRNNYFLVSDNSPARYLPPLEEEDALIKIIPYGQKLERVKTF